MGALGDGDTVAYTCDRYGLARRRRHDGRAKQRGEDENAQHVGLRKGRMPEVEGAGKRGAEGGRGGGGAGQREVEGGGGGGAGSVG